MASEKVKAVLCCRIPVELKERLQLFRQGRRIKTETESIVALLKAGLFVYSIEDKLKDPEMVEFLKSNLYNSMLADWIFDLDKDRLEALYGAFKSARDLRASGKA